MAFRLDLVGPYHYDSDMAHLHKKTKKGRPYYYVRETARVDGKPTIVNQVYLGSAERILQLAQASKGGCLRLKVQEFGALWLADLIEREVGLVSLIDAVVPPGAKEQGPSVGEYFLYAVFNRMVAPCSKRALPEWYEGTAIQFIRPVDADLLSSQRYWEKWSKVGKEKLQTIATRFFQRLHEIEPTQRDCFLFDTTNYYTYMAAQTESTLARRGKNKDGKDWLRQIGVALLVSRRERLPLFYREYEGNCHDSKLFGRLLKQITEIMHSLGKKEGELTLVFDKGMNSEENMACIDASERIHFITSYSPYFAKELTTIRLSRFQPVDTPKNRQLVERGLAEDRVVAFRTTGRYWGRERTVIVTHNPRTAAKQRYHFDDKLARLQQILVDLRSKVQTQKKHWVDPERVEKHVFEACEQLHLPKDLYEFSVEKQADKWNLIFRKNHYRINKYIDQLGINILVTDHMDWTTDEIVAASLDRYEVEQAFRGSKDDETVSVLPIRHWTDAKIRCHLLTCIIALAYLRLIELRLTRAGVTISANTAMRQLRRLHSCLCWAPGSKESTRMIEDPNEAQAQILRAFGHQVSGGVLQKIQS